LQWWFIDFGIFLSSNVVSTRSAAAVNRLFNGESIEAAAGEGDGKRGLCGETVGRGNLGRDQPSRRDARGTIEAGSRLALVGEAAGMGKQER
jgi:hypothetical protein